MSNHTKAHLSLTISSISSAWLSKSTRAKSGRIEFLQVRSCRITQPQCHWPGNFQPKTLEENEGWFLRYKDVRPSWWSIDSTRFVDSGWGDIWRNTLWSLFLSTNSQKKVSDFCAVAWSEERRVLSMYMWECGLMAWTPIVREHDLFNYFQTYQSMYLYLY